MDQQTVAVLAQPKVKRLLSSEYFPADGRLIEAWASMKQLQAEGPGCNPVRVPKPIDAAA